MDWRSTGSVFAAIMFLRSIPSLLPRELYNLLRETIPIPHFLRLLLSPIATITFPQFNDSDYTNDLYSSIQAYLSSRSRPHALSLTMFRSPNADHPTYSLAPGDSISDAFAGATLTWTHFAAGAPGECSTAHSFRLSFRHKHRDLVHEQYLPHVFHEANALRSRDRDRKLRTNRSSESGWTSSVAFTHSSTFDTLAMEPALKEEMKADLRRFQARKDYYSRVGRAWKRGYLLYGPPGTGKTSLVAAIANFLSYDVYDLELSAVKSNAQLRMLLVSTKTRSVVVVEDIDCTVDLPRRGSKQDADGSTPAAAKEGISLSGVLNCVDGLWSSCWAERVIIFTTNHKDSLDPALLRPGRMDKHISMGYCGFAAFKILAENYIGVGGEHPLMKEMEEVLPSARMTPADIAEVLLGCEDNPDRGMENVIETMRKRMEEKPQDVEEDESDAGTEVINVSS